MDLIPLKSSLIHSAAYNSDYNSLQINFHQGSIYVYYNVPESVFEQLITALTHKIIPATPLNLTPRALPGFFPNVVKAAKINTPQVWPKN